MATSAVCLLVSAASPDAFQGARARTIDMFAPVLAAVSAPFQDISAAVGSVSGLAELRAENASLKQENARLREWYQTALMLQADNQSLQELLNVKIDPRHRFITARIIADSGNTFARSVLVAAGSRDGVARDQAVMSGEGLVGRIVDAGEQASRVLLMTDLNSRIPVLVEGSRQRAILAGTNDTLPVLMHLPPDSALEEGARIVTSGQGGVFLPGIAIGRVVRDRNGDFAVQPFADPSRLNYVRIVEEAGDANLQTAEPRL